MINKVYEKIKQILKENIKFFLILILTLIICTIPLPYYINATGGLINTSNRININKLSGSYNMAYVSELKGTIPLCLIALLNNNWDIVKKEEVIYDNETVEDVEFRNHLFLEEANDTAIMVAYNLANKEYKINNRKIYVTYIDEDAITDLKIKDQIIKINDTLINTKQDVYDIINNSEGEITITLSDNTIKKAKIRIENNKKMIGIVIAEDLDIESNVKYNFKESESGPSGGFITSLAIYTSLTQDITHNLKIVGTGTIDINGNVGEIDGIKYKLRGAIKENADLFFVPSSNYEDALKYKKQNNYDIELISISNINEAINYLQNY